MSIACREGILRDHFSHVVADVKFLNRQGIGTVLFHNMANRFANQRHFRELEARLPSTKIIRVPSETDFYRFVLDSNEKCHKLIFLERKSLVDSEGRRINALTTAGAMSTMNSFGDLITNANFKGVIDVICRNIDQGRYDRVHILPAGKHTVKNELFTIEGSGTLIANNFEEVFKSIETDEELNIVMGILDRYKRSGYIKPRSREYMKAHQNNFYITLIDDIIVGCAEKLVIDEDTVELGALAISTKFRNQRVGVYTVNAFIDRMAIEGYRRILSLTNNPRLQRLYRRLGFLEECPETYGERQRRSPGVGMFHKVIGQ